MERTPDQPSLRRRSVLGAGAVLVAAIPALAIPAPASAATSDSGTATDNITVGAGQTYLVNNTTRVHTLTIAPGGIITAPAGYSLTMTINGVEKGAVLTATGGTDTRIAPGTYQGDIVLTVAQANPVVWAGVSKILTFPFRQALYIDATGVVTNKSVQASVRGGRVTHQSADDIHIASTGQVFDGVYVAGGTYTLMRPSIALTGDGRCDFVGYGAAIVGTGSTTTLVVDGATISNQGVVRTGVVATNGSNVIVKNSQITTLNGVLPADYKPTVDTSYMESAPWMLSISGNVRATNLLGTNSKATYINSAITSEAWGVLSTDSGSGCQLTAINSVVTNLSQDGYGTYAIGNAIEKLLGTEFNVGTYATINTGGTVYYGDSTPAAVAKLNTDLDLGLTDEELAEIRQQPTVINSRRFGVMWHGAGSVDVSGGTIINSRQTTFLDKGQQVTITVNGDQGARLNPGNGIIFQLMENDDPGPVTVNGVVLNEGIYHEPTGEPAKLASFDVTEVHSSDATATFTDINLQGDFYNAIRGGTNMVLTFDNSEVEGVITAAASKHHVSTISSANYEQLGEVTNTPQQVINNGVIAFLYSGSQWTVTGTSYQSKLVIAADAAVTAPPGRTLSMTVDGTAKTITPGTTYTGAIVLAIH